MYLLVPGEGRARWIGVRRRGIGDCTYRQGETGRGNGRGVCCTGATRGWGSPWQTRMRLVCGGLDG